MIEFHIYVSITDMIKFLVYPLLTIFAALSISTPTNASLDNWFQSIQNDIVIIARPARIHGQNAKTFSLINSEPLLSSKSIAEMAREAIVQNTPEELQDALKLHVVEKPRYWKPSRTRNTVFIELIYAVQDLKTPSGSLPIITMRVDFRSNANRTDDVGFPRIEGVYRPPATAAVLFPDEGQANEGIMKAVTHQTGGFASQLTK